MFDNPWKFQLEGFKESNFSRSSLLVNKYVFNDLYN